MKTKVNTIDDFAELLEKEYLARLKKDGLDCQLNIDISKVKVISGKKYTKVDVGTSGKYMVDIEGRIFGIKGYGKINKKKQYGTLDTINEWYWGDYTARKIV